MPRGINTKLASLKKLTAEFVLKEGREPTIAELNELYSAEMKRRRSAVKNQVGGFSDPETAKRASQLGNQKRWGRSADKDNSSR